MVVIISKIYFQTFMMMIHWPQWWKELKMLPCINEVFAPQILKFQKFPFLAKSFTTWNLWDTNLTFSMQVSILATCMIISGVREEALVQCFCTIRESSWHLFSGIFLPAWLALMPLQPIYLSWSLDLPQGETPQHSLTKTNKQIIKSKTSNRP